MEDDDFVYRGSTNTIYKMKTDAIKLFMKCLHLLADVYNLFSYRVNRRVFYLANYHRLCTECKLIANYKTNKDCTDIC